MLSQILELQCNCGKIIQVPEWRAGQKGRCSQCSQMILIPSVYDPNLWEPLLNRFDGTQAPTQGNICIYCGGPTAENEQVCNVCSQVMHSEQSAPIQSPSSRASIFFPSIIMWILGILLGIVLGPGYLEIVDETVIPAPWMQKIKTTLASAGYEKFAPEKNRSLSQNTEPKNTEPKNTEPKNTEPKNTEPKNTEPKNAEPKNVEPKNTEPKNAEPEFRLGNPGQQKILGIWYRNMNKSFRLLEQTLSLPLYKKYQKTIVSIQEDIKEIRQYGTEFKSVYVDLYMKDSNGKILSSWIAQEKKKAETSQRKESLDFLNQFAQTGVLPLDLDVAEKELAEMSTSLQGQAEKKEVNTKTIGAIRKHLKKILEQMIEKQKSLKEISKEFITH